MKEIPDYVQGTLSSLRKSFLGERKKVDFLRAERDTLRSEIDRVRYVVAELLRHVTPPDDWACAHCRPKSDMLTPGFLCSMHEAEKWVQQSPDKTASAKEAE